MTAAKKDVLAPIKRQALGAFGGLGGRRGPFLRLLLRLGLLRIVVDACFTRPASARNRCTRSDAVAPLAIQALAASEVELEAVGMILRQQRIVEADLLDEAAVARIAAVGDDDVVVRAFLGAAAGETNFKEPCCFFLDPLKV